MCIKLTFILIVIEFRDLSSFFREWQLKAQEPIKIEIAGKKMIYYKKKMRNSKICLYCLQLWQQKKNRGKTALKEHQKFNDVKCFLQMRRPWKIFTLSSIPAFHTRGCDLIIWRVLIHLCISHSKPFFLKTSGDTMGSFLCIYLKCMHEVQWLTSTSLLDIHDWIRHG